MKRKDTKTGKYKKKKRNTAILKKTNSEIRCKSSEQRKIVERKADYRAIKRATHNTKIHRQSKGQANAQFPIEMK